MDTQLAYPFPDGLDVSWMSIGKTVEPGKDRAPGALIF
jgi:hypothetical protein